MSKTALVHLTRARQEIQTARTLNDVRIGLNKGQQLQLLAKQVGASVEIKNEVTELLLRWKRRAGEMLREGAKKGQRAKKGQPKKEKSHDVTLSLPKLDEIGVSKMESSRWQSIASIPEEDFEQVICQTKEAKEELTETAFFRAAKERKREKKREKNRRLVEEVSPIIITAADTRYQTIVIDPPWDWGDEGDVDQFGRGRPTYATMTIEEVAALPVGDLAEKDAHIYLWITNRSLPKGFALLEGWGFRYVTALTWCKPSIGMGNYFRGSTEHVLFGVKGSLSLLRNNVGTWFQAPRQGRHSAKPDAFFKLVESCSPGPWLEMFARESRPGWMSWGAEV